MSLALTNWRILLTDLRSNPVADISEEAIAPLIYRELNGFDRVEFALNAESQAAYAISPMQTLVKVWRDVPGRAPFPSGTPNVVGVIAGRVNDARDRTVSYTAYSPFWRLQFRYHIDPHDFTYLTGRGVIDVNSPINDPYGGTDPTDIMRLMIQFTNAVVEGTSGDRTGIRPLGARADYTGANPAVLYDVRYDVGQNTWDLINDIVTTPGFPDLDPTYIHVAGSTDLVWLNTIIHKGSVRSQSFDYRTGSKNLDDVRETTAVEPGEYANYVVTQGQGDKSQGNFNPLTGESGGTQTIARADGSSQSSIALGLPNLIQTHGLYMYFERGDNWGGPVMRRKHAEGRLRRLAYPNSSYELTPSQAITWAWPYDFDVGDLVTVRADRDSIQIDEQLRIQSLSVQRTANKMERLTVNVIDPASYKVYSS